jgi:hypothetical protein
MKRIIVPLAVVIILAGCGSQNQASTTTPQSSASSISTASPQLSATPPAVTSASAAPSVSTERTMEDADYPELIEGSLTKDEMTNVSQVLIQNGIVEDGQPDDYLLYFYNPFKTINIDIVQESIPDSEIKLDYIFADEANRYLSSFTDFRFTPETTATEDDGSAYAIYLQNGYVYWKEGGIGGGSSYDETAEIIEGTYDDTQMNLQVHLQRNYFEDGHIEELYYNIELAKQEDGRYRVTAVEQES